MGRVFIVVNLFSGPPLLLISYRVFALHSFNLCKKTPNPQSSTAVLAAAVDL
jgi:hypothetical protein